MTQDMHDTPERPRQLTKAELDGLRDVMKGSITWAQTELRQRDHTPNALTAETLRQADAGVDVVTVASGDELFAKLGIRQL